MENKLRTQNSVAVHDVRPLLMQPFDLTSRKSSLPDRKTRGCPFCIKQNSLMGPQFLWSPYNVARHSVWWLSDVVVFFLNVGPCKCIFAAVTYAATLVMSCVLVKRFTRHMFQHHNLIMWFQRKWDTEVMIKKKQKIKELMKVWHFCFYAVFMPNIKMLCLLSPTDCGIFF